MERFLIIVLLMPGLLYGVSDFNDLSNRVEEYQTEHQQYLTQGHNNSTKQVSPGDILKEAVARIKRALDNKRLWLIQEIKNSALTEVQKQELLQKLPQ